MFTRLQHSLCQAQGGWFPLSTTVQDKLRSWGKLVHELAARPTHLCKLDPFIPTWERATDASGAGIGRVCQEPKGHWFVWMSPCSKATQARLVTDTNPTEDGTIKDLNIAALLAQVQLFAPNMAPL